MSSKSRSQQRLFGMVHACQKSGNCPSKQVKDIAKTITYKDAKDFASTKHNGLPERKGKKKRKLKIKSFKEWLEERLKRIE